MSKKMTLKSLVEDYTSWLSNQKTATAIRHHLKPVLALFGGWQPQRVGPAQVQEFLAEQRKNGLSDVTAYQRAKILRTVLSWAVRMGKMPSEINFVGEAIMIFGTYFRRTLMCLKQPTTK